MLTLTGITKTFNPGTLNEKKALQGIDLHLDAGDFAAIVGSNGAGKSTLSLIHIYMAAFGPRSVGFYYSTQSQTVEGFGPKIHNFVFYFLLFVNYALFYTCFRLDCRGKCLSLIHIFSTRRGSLTMLFSPPSMLKDGNSWIAQLGMQASSCRQAAVDTGPSGLWGMIPTE